MFGDFLAHLQILGFMGFKAMDMPNPDHQVTGSCSGVYEKLYIEKVYLTIKVAALPFDVFKNGKKHYLKINSYYARGVNFN